MNYVSSSSLQPTYAWALTVTAAAALVSFAVSLEAGVLLLLAAIVGWWAWRNNQSALLLLLVLSPLLPLLKATQTLNTITLVKDALILTLALRLFLLPLLSKRLPYRRNVLFAPAALLVIWTAVGTLRADNLVLGILRSREIVLYLLLYLAVLYLPPRRHLLRELLQWQAIMLVVVLALAIYQPLFAADSAVLRFDPARSVWIPRVSSTFAHPSIFGEYLVAAASIFFAGGLSLRSRKYRYAALLGAAATLPAIYFTYSRAVWLGALAAITVIVIAKALPRKSFRLQRAVLGKNVGLFLVAVAIVVTLLLRATPVGVFVRSAFDPAYKSNAARLEFLSRLIAPLDNASAMIGEGLGDVTAQNFRRPEVTSFDLASGAGRTVQLAKDSTLVDNQHIKTFIELGFIGLLIYVWLYLRFARASWQAARSPDATKATLGLAGLGFLAAFIVQGFFIDIWDIFPTNLYFWGLAALISNAANVKAGLLKPGFNRTLS